MRRVALALSLLGLSGGCAGLAPATPLPAGDPRPLELLDAWRTRTGDREGLRAVARFSVDAPGAGVGGGDLSLRSRQRLWLARPAMLRVEVLGFLDTALAVLTTDGERYAWLQIAERSFDSGPIYDGLLWDAARLDLTPSEAVEVMLGVPQPDADLRADAAWSVGEDVRIALVDAAGRVRRVVEFDGGGALRRLEQHREEGGALWEVRFGDYVDVEGSPFARELALRDADGTTRAELRLRDVELNPALPPELFRLEAPEGAGFGAEGG